MSTNPKHNTSNEMCFPITIRYRCKAASFCLGYADGKSRLLLEHPWTNSRRETCFELCQTAIDEGLQGNYKDEKNVGYLERPVYCGRFPPRGHQPFTGPAVIYDACDSWAYAIADILPPSQERPHYCRQCVRAGIRGIFRRTAEDPAFGSRPYDETMVVLQWAFTRANVLEMAGGEAGWSKWESTLMAQFNVVFKNPDNKQDLRALLTEMYQAKRVG